MLIEAIKHPIRYTLLDGREVRLVPGEPVDIPDLPAKTLLAKAPDRVRGVEPPYDVQPAGPNVRPVYWETEPGIIQGPAQVSLMARMTDQFWLCVEYAGTWRWINTTLLRSKQAFERQSACRCCGAHTFWTSIYGVRICSRCHPLTDARFVQKEGAWNG